MKTLIQEEFEIEERLRIKKYYSTNKKKLSGFENFDDFSDWYFHELYFFVNKCHYCETSIFIIRELLNNNIIQYRRVGKSGTRGANFEIDRMNPFDGYSRENCVLSCYYCNNDKSNTFNYEIYRNIVAPCKKEAWKLIYKDFKNNQL